VLEVLDHRAGHGSANSDRRDEIAISGASPGKGTLHRIVVVGGSAAGLELVTRLGDRLSRRTRASVTLIECARSHLWKPISHAVAAGSIDAGEHEPNYLARAHRHSFQYRFGEMARIDRVAKEVKLAAAVDGEGQQIAPARTIGYDGLAIAIGSRRGIFIDGLLARIMYRSLRLMLQRALSGATRALLALIACGTAP
jgi:NADPH-dependent 2,4-dienoyl-CoA reductase/sulfur reductase-like enzyme